MRITEQTETTMFFKFNIKYFVRQRLEKRNALYFSILETFKSLLNKKKEKLNCEPLEKKRDKAICDTF